MKVKSQANIFLDKFGQPPLYYKPAEIKLSLFKKKPRFSGVSYKIIILFEHRGMEDRRHQPLP